MRILTSCLTVLALQLLVGVASAKDTGLTVELKLESDEVTAGDVLRAGAVVTNHTRKDQFVLVEGFLSTVAGPRRERA